GPRRAAAILGALPGPGTGDAHAGAGPSQLCRGPPWRAAHLGPPLSVGDVVVGSVRRRLTRGRRAADQVARVSPAGEGSLPASGGAAIAVAPGSDGSAGGRHHLEGADRRRPTLFPAPASGLRNP